ncbi:hypothetical protein [Chitinimonas koreensis]|uniref:hypothetical protein n=1 Tax=Chitinimonas koreensis TaxID=356302 RepID=UPI0027E57FE1|nr:hypothetical protein [Chitinimonas koreensis]
MRRWNGWGDDATSMSLNDAALAMLGERLGPGRPPRDVGQAELLSAVPASRLPEHPLIRRDAASRFGAALGESYPDWLRKRCGPLPPVPDGVAFPRAAKTCARCSTWRRPTAGSSFPSPAAPAWPAISTAPWASGRCCRSSSSA